MTRTEACRRPGREHDAYVATVTELERIHGYKIDAVLPCGCHRHWSTHCRHGGDEGHRACSASTMRRELAPAPGARLIPLDVEVRRRAASCKGCSAPCVCPCHGEGGAG